MDIDPPIANKSHTRPTFSPPENQAEKTSVVGDTNVGDTNDFPDAPHYSCLFGHPTAVTRTHCPHPRRLEGHHVDGDQVALIK